MNEVADVLGVSRASVYRAMQAGELSYLQVRPSVRRVTEKQLQDYLDERQSPAPPA